MLTSLWKGNVGKCFNSRAPACAKAQGRILSRAPSRFNSRAPACAKDSAED